MKEIFVLKGWWRTS
ncbi:TPA: trp operon leader peptide [Escherichia coli]|nr:trp operon leader peptide [Escherichia coli]HEA3638668.1 trp operon leader peptide [Escherichia coli]